MIPDIRSGRIIFSLLVIFVLEGQSQVTYIAEVPHIELNTTSRTELYIWQNQRQFDSNLKTLDQALLDFKQSYNNRADVLLLDANLLVNKLTDFDNYLNPLELLDDVSDYCVQKYRKLLPKAASSKLSVTNCIYKATSSYNSIISTTEAVVTSLRSYYTNTFKVNLDNCKKKFNIPSLQSNYTDCVQVAVNAAVTTTVSNNNLFYNRLEVAGCSANSKFKEVFDCNSSVIYSTFTVMGEVDSKVKNCIAGNEFCPPCRESGGDRCPYQLAWHMTESDKNNETIINPFKGLSQEAQCLQINFVSNNTAIA